MLNKWFSKINARYMIKWAKEFGFDIVRVYRTPSGAVYLIDNEGVYWRLKASKNV